MLYHPLKLALRTSKIRCLFPGDMWLCPKRGYPKIQGCIISFLQQYHHVDVFFPYIEWHFLSMPPISEQPHLILLVSSIRFYCQKNKIQWHHPIASSSKMPGFKPNKPRHSVVVVVFFNGQDMYGRTLTRPAVTATDKWGNWGQVGVYNQIQGQGTTVAIGSPGSPGWVEVFNSTQGTWRWEGMDSGPSFFFFWDDDRRRLCSSWGCFFLNLGIRCCQLTEWINKWVPERDPSVEPGITRQPSSTSM